MSITAKELTKAASNTAALESVVREQLRMIDVKLQAAPRRFGLNVVAIPLESSFSLPGLDKMEQQRFVYSNIIKSLKARGFAVSILLDKTNTQLFVTFEVTFNEEEIRAMNAILQEASISVDEIPQVNGGNAPADNQD